MKLSDYFKQRQSQQLSPQVKSELFSRIQKEKLVWTPIVTSLDTKRFFFASKKIMYTSLAALLVVLVFWWFLLDKNEIVDFWFFSVQSNNPNGVVADYVAEIIEFNGEYSLMRWDEKILDSAELQNISDGDVIKLSEWTKLVFTLADWTQARIDWPAEFSISKWKKWYQIFLMDWKFFRIYCPECVTDIEIITPDTSIIQWKDQLLDVQIAKEDGEMLVKNNGDSVTIVTTKDDNKTETKLESSDLIAIDSSDDSLDILKDSDLMLVFMEKNNISGTFTLSSEDIQWPTISLEQPTWALAMQTVDVPSDVKSDSNIVTTRIQDSEASSEIEWNQTDDPLLQWIIDVIVATGSSSDELDEDIVSELWILEDSQQVPSSDQMQSLKSNMNTFFLMNTFESIYTQDNADKAIVQLAERINDVASSFGYSIRAKSNLSDIQWVANSLASDIENDWYVSPSYILQIQKFANWCGELNNILFSEDVKTLDDWNHFKSNLPNKLKLM